MIDTLRIISFLRESNMIEGIHREPTQAEIDATASFLRLPSLTVADVANIVHVYQPGAVLRNVAGQDVRIANAIPPRGGPHIHVQLMDLLALVNAGSISAYDAHVAYERLHPFTDGNGRSGRALWYWMANKAIESGGPDEAILWSFVNNRINFLHSFYYQTLARSQSSANA